MTKPQEPPKSLDAFADERAQARHTENQELARSARALRAANAEMAARVSDLTKKLALFERLDRERLDPPTWLTPRTSTTRHPAIASMMLSDTHWDEVVRPEQIDHVNAYNRKIAEQRLQRAFEGAVTMARDRLKGFSYEGFCLLMGGDMLSGLIHEELRETNEAPIMESVLTLVEPLEAGIHLLRKEFGRVDVEAVVGNHGRRTMKPVAKNRAQDNFDWLVYKIIERDFRKVPGVTVRVSDAADAQFSVYSTRYLLTHGDQFKGGSGISAALSPLMLGAARKTRRQITAGRPYDVMCAGHWHQHMSLPSKGLLMGGTLKGQDEYGYVSNFEIEPPSQAFWLTTPEHGVVFPDRIYVQDRKAEGW